MHLKFNYSFSDYIIDTVIQSKLKDDKLSLRQTLHLKIMSILDHVFSALSSDYQRKKMEYSHRVSLKDEFQKYGLMTRVTTVYTSQNSEVSEWDDCNEFQVIFKDETPEEVINEENDENELSLPKEIQLDSEEIDLLNQLDAKESQTVNPQDIESDDVENVDAEPLSQIDVDGLQTVNLIIEQKAQEYLSKKLQEELRAWVQDRQLGNFLISNPGALAGLMAVLQFKDARSNLEAFFNLLKSWLGYEEVDVDDAQYENGIEQEPITLNPTDKID